MNCPHCHHEIQETDRFCPHCDGYIPNNIPSSETPSSSNPLEHARFQSQSNNFPSYKANGFAIAGFICSIFVSLLGLIFSAIGISKANKTGNGGKLATAGLIISIISIILGILLNFDSYNTILNSYT